jgi:hypothetical protein
LDSWWETSFFVRLSRCSLVFWSCSDRSFTRS